MSTPKQPEFPIKPEITHPLRSCRKHIKNLFTVSKNGNNSTIQIKMFRTATADQYGLGDRN